VIFNVIGPRLLSHHVGLHPLLVFFAVLAGARAAGLWGAILGVPLVAVVLTMLSFYRSSQEERTARLQSELPGQHLVSTPNAAEPPSSAPAPPFPTPVSH
jgi:predicted PurR-regulated permease PerM